MLDSPTTRVFVVDDEQLIATTVATILKQDGFEAIPFTSPLEALENARLRPPNLLISDVVMPQMSGVDLAIQVRQILPECKILLFSGQATTTDLLQNAREQGLDFQLVMKPIHPTDLLQSIRELTKD